MTASMSATSMSTATRVAFWGVDESPDIGDPEGTKDLLAPRRSEPMILVLHIVVGDYGRHDNSLGCAPRVCAEVVRGAYYCAVMVVSPNEAPPRHLPGKAH